MERTYLYLTIGTLVVVGGALIGVVYGPAALLTALPLLILGALALLGLWMSISAVSRWREKSDRAYHEAARQHIANLEKQDERHDEADGAAG